MGCQICLGNLYAGPKSQQKASASLRISLLDILLKHKNNTQPYCLWRAERTSSKIFELLIGVLQLCNDLRVNNSLQKFHLSLYTWPLAKCIYTCKKKWTIVSLLVFCLLKQFMKGDLITKIYKRNISKLMKHSWSSMSLLSTPIKHT